jgi:hypothetical protein
MWGAVLVHSTMIAADVAVIAQLGHPLSADLLRLARDNAAYVWVFVADVAFVEYLRPGLLLAVCTPLPYAPCDENTHLGSMNDCYFCCFGMEMAPALS